MGGKSLRSSKCTSTDLKRLLVQCMDLFRKGLITPIEPSTLFETMQIEDAFRYMQKGQHIGKIVVRMAAQGCEIQSTARMRNLVFNPDAAYLLVGGLGGLGQSISTWMVEKGAKHLIFISRSAGQSEKHRAFISELTSQGCSVQVFAGSVTNFQDVKNIVESTGQPIAGVFQMSMILKVLTDFYLR